MKTIIFRTNAGQHTGLGHLVRCLQLAKQLQKAQVNILFVLDYIEDSILPFMAEFNFMTLYDKPQGIIDQYQDAEKFNKIIAIQHPTFIVLDDYRLDKIWETLISHPNHKLCVIDDILRPHHCDILVDMRWRGNKTQQSYDHLVSSTTKKLLGPQYILLADHYRKSNCKENSQLSADAKYLTHSRENHFSHHSSNNFTIMIGVGGGGDLSLCQQIINRLLAHQHQFEKPLRLLPVLGPLSINNQNFVDYYQNQSNVMPLIGMTDLYPYFCETDLYIGATGGTIYQLLALKIPMLTFAIADNQRSAQQTLADIGHYFHLTNFTQQDIDYLPFFAQTVEKHYPRIKNLLDHAKISIDALGAQRIAKNLLAERGSTTLVEPARQIAAQIDNVKTQELSTHHQIRAVVDQDINHYLASRNLISNSKNMIKTDNIAVLSHYAWWFNSKRESFLLSKNQQPCLYIWHEIQTFQQKNYLIGGWFVCHDETGFDDALLALNWQLSHCQQQYPDTPWVAVIHRKNKFVKLLNQYVGFTEITPNDANGIAIASLFPEASYNDFYYVEYSPKKSDN